MSIDKLKAIENKMEFSLPFISSPRPWSRTCYSYSWPKSSYLEPLILDLLFKLLIQVPLSLLFGPSVEVVKALALSWPEFLIRDPGCPILDLYSRRTTEALQQIKLKATTGRSRHWLRPTGRTSCYISSSIKDHSSE